MLLHDLEELDDNLGDGADQDLTLTTLLSIIDALESIVQHADTHHLKISVLVRLFKRDGWMA